MGNKGNKQNKEQKEKVTKEIPKNKKIDYENLEIIKQQKKNCICKINDKDGNEASGFLCMVPFPNFFNLLPVLVTNSNLMKQKDINNGIQLKITFNNDGKENIKTITIDNTRKIFLGNKQEFNIAIIEIMLEDDFNNLNFLKIDEIPYIENDSNYFLYKKQSIYSIFYVDSNVLNTKFFQSEIFYDYKISHPSWTFIYSTPNNIELLGAPIINLRNYKLIGIHQEETEKEKVSYGALIAKSIYNFNKLNIKKEKNIENIVKKNYIYIMLKINEEDVNKKIYYLDNTNFTDPQTNENHYHDKLNEINELNTKLYVYFDEISEIKFEKYIIPKKEGLYSLKLELMNFSF